MMPASIVTMPRSAPPAVAAFPASARVGDRRNARFFRHAAACGGDEQPPSMAPMPPSLRAIQAERKQAAARLGVPQAAATNAAECAVAALVKAVGVVQGAAAGGAAEAARGAGDAVAWVVRQVHQLQSPPDLAVGLLGMVASCLGTAVEGQVERARARAQAKKEKPDSSSGKEEDPEPADGEEEEDDDDEEEEGNAEDADDLPQLVEPDMEKELWSRIGIMHGALQGDNGDDVTEGLDVEEIREIISARARRRKAAYERIIAAGGASSLILSNYAQLLYEFDKDIKRAEMYFKQAVAAEPADGEAMRRYAIFLWHARGDMVGAEDMFTYAIDEEPESSHIRSSYAWFLWMTGGVGTCLIDNLNGDDAE